jgi:photosystem II stability/assembly factor-like uncharacterized protein
MKKNSFLLFITVAIALTLLLQPAQIFAQFNPAKSTYLPLIGRMRQTWPIHYGLTESVSVAVTVDPQHPEIVYAGVSGMGVYKSTDNGSKWFPSSLGLDNLNVYSLVVDPTDSNIVYAGTYYSGSALNNGVFKSTDGGASWNATGHMVNTYHGKIIERPIVYALAIDPKNPQILYAGTRMAGLVPGQAVYGGGGVFRTKNGGQTWETANTNLPAEDLYIYDIAVDPVHSGKVYIAMHESGAYRSNNYGDTWTVSNNNLPPDRNGIVSSGRSIVLDPSQPNILYYGVWHNQGVFKSSNYAQDWISKGLKEQKIYTLTLNTKSPQNLFASTSDRGLFRTVNGGSSWENVLGSHFYFDIAINNSVSPNIVFAGADTNGIYRSMNGGVNWEVANNGIYSNGVNAVVISPTQPDVIYTSMLGVGLMRSTSGGYEWAKTGTGLNVYEINQLVQVPGAPNLWYATTNSNGVYVSSNGAASWAPLGNGYPQKTSADQDIIYEESNPDEGTANMIDILPDTAAASGPIAGLSLAVNPNQNSNVLLGTKGRGIWGLSSAGVWTPSQQTLGKVNTLLFDTKTISRVYAGLDSDNGGLLLSKDSGATWTIASNDLSGKTVFSLYQKSNGILLAGTNTGLYTSSDSGLTWQIQGLGDQSIQSILVDPEDPNLIFAGTLSSAFKSKDGGVSWQDMGSEFWGAQVKSIIADPGTPSRFYFATRFSGLISLEK